MTAFIRSALTFAAGMACAIALMVTGTATATDSPSPVGHRTWEQHRQCKYEDGVNCFWNADSMGNGTGHSFFTVQMPGKKHMVCVIYTKKKDHHWDYCS